MKTFFLTAMVLLSGTTLVKAQSYTPKVSKDSVGVLVARQDALKASMKVQELKLKEAEEEADVEN